MGPIVKILLLLLHLPLMSLVLFILYSLLLAPDAVIVPEKDGWWGKGAPKPDNNKVNSFKVQVPQSTLDDLKTRLNNSRFGEDLENTDNFHYGVQVSYMKQVQKYWLSDYDWKKYEAMLNSRPQFKTQIEGIDVHFVRVKSPKARNPKPLLMVHGWPGSIWEFYKIIPMLIEPEKYGGSESDAFEVICPSIPGYGFSESPHQTGFDSSDAARIFQKLMARIGFNRYYVQGGDWGSMIVTIMAELYPSNVIGAHVNMPVPTMRVSGILRQIVANIYPKWFASENQVKTGFPMSKVFGQLILESGYMHIQATKPDTVGLGLNDSPIGLAGYILEKFSTWTNPDYRDLPDGGLNKRFTLDELLTNVMIYWVNGNIVSSQRFYKENFGGEFHQKFGSKSIYAPMGLAALPYELMTCPRFYAEERYKNIVQYTEFTEGGHFAAFEVPGPLADDIRSFVRKLEKKDKKEEL